MSELVFKQTTLRFPEPLWEEVEKVANAQKRDTNQVVEEALTDYISNHTPQKPLLTSEERKAVAVKKLYERAARNRRAFAEGKIHPLPKDIPLEQVWEALSGIKDSLAAEVIKEREEGW